MNLILKHKKHLLALGVLAALLLALIGLNPRCSVGPVAIENVNLINQSEPKWPHPGNMNTFQNQEGVFCAIQTSGIDIAIRTQWFYEEMLLKEIVVRTQSNRAVVGLLPPLEAGNYRVTIALADGSPLRARDFMVSKYQPQVVPVHPVPEEHIDWEDDKLLVSVPFAFDEIWSVDGTDWQINEVKVVFLQDSVVVAVVAIVNFNPLDLLEETARKMSQPVALYAVQKGYIETARHLQIDGKVHQLRNMFVSLYNPEVGQGCRIAFEFAELSALLNSH